MKNASAIRHSSRFGNTTRHAAPHNAKHAIDWRDRFPLAVARMRCFGLTNKSHRQFPCPCPARARITRYGRENDWRAASTSARPHWRQRRPEFPPFAARAVACRSLRTLALKSKKTLPDPRNKHESAHDKRRNHERDKAKRDQFDG